MGVRDLVGAVRRYLPVFGLTIAAALAIAVVAAKVRGNPYEATATVLVDAAGDRGDLGTTEAIRTVLLPTMAEVVGSRGFRDTVAERLRPSVDPNAIELDGEVDGLLLLRVVARAEDPPLAKRAADAAAAELGRQRVARDLTVSVIEQATVPTGRAGPGLLLYLIAGGALGVIGGVLLALLVGAWRSPRTTHTDQAWQQQLPPPNSSARAAAPAPTASAQTAAPIAAETIRPRPGGVSRVPPPPVLGEIPASSALAASGALQLRAPEPVVVAAFDELSRAVERAAAGATVVAVAPVAGGDGASTVAAGLALTLASRGVAVTVVDADLTRPATHEYLGVSNGVGLADLGRGVTIGDVIRPTGSVGLSVVPAGRSNGRDPAVALAETLPPLVDALAGQVVLIDAPSPLDGRVGVVAAGVGGHVLLVADASRMGTGAVDAAISALGESGADVLGVVVTYANSRLEPR